MGEMLDAIGWIWDRVLIPVMFLVFMGYLLYVIASVVENLRKIAKNTERLVGAVDLMASRAQANVRGPESANY